TRDRTAHWSPPPAPGPARTPRWTPAAPGRSPGSAPADATPRRARPGRPGRSGGFSSPPPRRRAGLTGARTVFVAENPAVADLDGAAGVVTGQVGVVG